MDVAEPAAQAEAHDHSLPGNIDSSDPTGIRPRALLDDILNSVRTARTGELCTALECPSTY